MIHLFVNLPLVQYFFLKQNRVNPILLMEHNLAEDIIMKETSKNFKTMLKKYLAIRGLDIIVVLKDGTEIELFKNRELIDDVIVTLENGKDEKKINLSDIKSVDMFAA